MLKKISKKDIINFTWSYWRRRKALGFFTIGFLTLSTVMDIFIPLFSGEIVDYMSISPEKGYENVVISIVVFVGFLLGFSFFRFISFAFYNRYECLSMRDILVEALQKVQLFSSDWHANNFAGGTVRKITRARSAFEMFEDTLILNIYPAILVMFGATFMLWFILPSVGAFALIMTLIYIGLSIFISLKYLAPRYQQSAQKDTQVGAVLSDIITGNSTVKNFGAEDKENITFYQTAEEWRKKTQISYRWFTGMDFVRDLVRIIMIAGMLIITFYLWKNGSATPGDIIVVISTYFLLGGYLRDIGMHVANLQKSVSEMEDVIWYWKTDVAVKDKPDARNLVADKGELHFDKISFAYGNQENQIYEDFSITINSGEKVALVGHSGSGKSTFVKVLQRLYDLQSGEIYIDGVNISDVTQSSLRQAIALVPQDPILFHRSLRDNIAYAKPQTSEEEIVNAAQKAYAHEFIMSLPQGYNTLVGERGIKLSGGERQRVAIARAILSDAPILILDEATSALDSVSEHYIQKALAELMKGRTTITIAHRLSTIKDVDRILVFDQGKVVEQGTHNILLNDKKSHYKKLYDMQVLGLIE